MRSHPKCKKCGERIGFIPYQKGPGVVGYIPVNLDDRQPHWRRCNVNDIVQKLRHPPVRSRSPFINGLSPAGQRSLNAVPRGEKRDSHPDFNPQRDLL